MLPLSNNEIHRYVTNSQLTPCSCCSVPHYLLVLMSSFRFTPHAADKMRQAIREAGGVEVFAIGDVNEAGIVHEDCQCFVCLTEGKELLLTVTMLLVLSSEYDGFALVRLEA